MIDHSNEQALQRADVERIEAAARGVAGSDEVLVQALPTSDGLRVRVVDLGDRCDMDAAGGRAEALRDAVREEGFDAEVVQTPSAPWLDVQVSSRLSA